MWIICEGTQEIRGKKWLRKSSFGLATSLAAHTAAHSLFSGLFAELKAFTHSSTLWAPLAFGLISQTGPKKAPNA